MAYTADERTYVESLLRLRGLAENQARRVTAAIERWNVPAHMEIASVQITKLEVVVIVKYSDYITVEYQELATKAKITVTSWPGEEE